MPGQKRQPTQQRKARLRAFSLLWLESLGEDRLHWLMTSHQLGAALPRDADVEDQFSRKPVRVMTCNVPRRSVQLQKPNVAQAHLVGLEIVLPDGVYLQSNNPAGGHVVGEFCARYTIDPSAD